MDRESQLKYFMKSDGVTDWWNPEGGIYKKHYSRELTVLNERMRIPEGSNVLDLGTGKGRFARYFASCGCKCTAVDLNLKMIEKAVARADKEGLSDKIEFVQSPVDAFLDNLDKTFDIVSAMEFLDHYPDIEGLFKSVNNILSPEGTFVFSYVSALSLYGKMFGLAMSKVKSRELRVARPYNPRYLEQLLEQNGFERQSYGVGLCTIIIRENISPAIQKLLAIPIIVESVVKPYFSSDYFAKRCIHVVVIAKKKPGA